MQNKNGHWWNWTFLVILIVGTIAGYLYFYSNDSSQEIIGASISDDNPPQDTLPPKPQQPVYDKSLCRGSAKCFIGTVDYIVDGDTLDVDGTRIRLVLVNTPEKNEAGFSEAKQFTANLCPVGSQVLVDEDDGQPEGSYDRIVAVVYCDDKLLNEQLLESGHSGMYTYFCDKSEFKNEDWAVKFGC